VSFILNLFPVRKQFPHFLFLFKNNTPVVCVLNLVSQVRDVILMSVYLDLGNPGGSGFWNGGVYEQGEGNRKLVYKQPGNEVDGSYHSKEGSKL
jgi:hypothetical protein